MPIYGAKPDYLIEYDVITKSMSMATKALIR
jgi:hypothetical protein